MVNYTIYALRMQENILEINSVAFLTNKFDICPFLWYPNSKHAWQTEILLR